MTIRESEQKSHPPAVTKGDSKNVQVGSQLAIALRWVLSTAALVAVYVLAGRLGLRFGFIDQATLIWPPTGIALAAVLIGGYRVVPALVIGAFVTSLSEGSSIPFAMATAFGNPLEAVLGAYLLRRVGNFDIALDKIKDVVSLVFLAAMVSTIASATIGAVALCGIGESAWSNFLSIWTVWWMGDAMSDLLVAPAILTWVSKPKDGRRAAEFVLPLMVFSALGFVVFAGQALDTTTVAPLSYWPFPTLIWIAFRYGGRGAATFTLVIATIAVFGSAQEVGPFVGGSQQDTLRHLLAYLFVLALTSLTLSAVIAERRRAQTANDEKTRGLELVRAVAVTANDANNVHQTWHTILRLVCNYTGWPVGHVYTTSSDRQSLESSKVWHLVDPERFQTFCEVTERTIFHSGEGLPGRILASKRPAWIIDVTEDQNFPRAGAAMDIGVRGAFAFPVLVGTEVVSVMEYFSPEPQPPNEMILDIMVQIGTQLGRVIEREQLQGALAKVLSGYVPICSWCKAIRQSDNHWVPVEQYVQERTGAQFTHGLCQDCARKHQSQL